MLLLNASTQDPVRAVIETTKSKDLQGGLAEYTTDLRLVRLSASKNFFVACVVSDKTGAAVISRKVGAAVNRESRRDL